MSLATADLPDDLAALRAFAQACQQELRAAQNVMQVYSLEIEKLKFQIAKLQRMQFGRSSERITAKIEQLEFQLEELEAAEAEAAARADAQDQPSEVLPQPVKAKPKRKPLPEHLPREDVVIEPANNGACTCPDCGGAMKHLGEDVSEALDTCRDIFASSAMSARNLPAARATRSPRPPRRRCQRRADGPRPLRWRICW